MDKWLEHEEERWQTHEIPGLADRVKKMYNPLKLKAFLLVAQKYNSKGLYILGCKRAAMLGYGWVIPREDGLSATKPDLKEPEPEIRKIRL
jgi:hypothetical protein